MTKHSEIKELLKRMSKIPNEMKDELTYKNVKVSKLVEFLKLFKDENSMGFIDDEYLYWKDILNILPHEVSEENVKNDKIYIVTFEDDTTIDYGKKN